jgi:hypothetical protein
MYSLVLGFVLSALRDRVWLSLWLLMVLVALLAFLFGAMAMVEQHETIIIFASSSLRLTGCLVVILYMSFVIQRQRDHKEIEAYLVRPLARWQLLFSYWLCSLVLIGLVVSSSIVVMVIWGVAWRPLLIWSSSFALELSMVASFTVACSLVLRHNVAAILSTLAFYMLARMSGYFLLMLEQFILAGKVKSVFGISANSVLSYIIYIVPRLDLFTRSEWLLSVADHPLPLSLLGLQTITSTFFIGCMVWCDMVRRPYLGRN